MRGRVKNIDGYRGGLVSETKQTYGGRGCWNKSPHNVDVATDDCQKEIITRFNLALIMAAILSAFKIANC